MNTEFWNGWPNVALVNAELRMPVRVNCEPPKVVWLKFVRDATVLLKLIEECAPSDE